MRPAKGKNIVDEKFERNCTMGFRSSKNLPIRKSQPNEPIPSLGKEI
jgi:hypothetical protein